MSYVAVWALNIKLFLTEWDFLVKLTLITKDLSHPVLPAPIISYCPCNNGFVFIYLKYGSFLHNSDASEFLPRVWRMLLFSTEVVPLADFIHIVFTRMPGERRYLAPLGSLSKCLCDIFRALVISVRRFSFVESLKTAKHLCHSLGG